MKNIDLYKAFYRSVGYPLFLRMIKRPTISMLEARLKSQFFTREKIQEIQLCKLKKVLVNAAENVPYYRDTFHEIGFIPSDMKSLLEFEKLDFFITKDFIRENTDAFISEKSATYEIYNMLGQRVSNGKLKASLNVSNLEAGVYLMKATIDDTISTRRFVKE